MTRFQLKKCVIPLYKRDEKGMPVKNFKIANAKNLTMELKKKTTKLRYIYSLRFYSLAGTQRYKRTLWKKKRNQGNKIKDSGEAYDIN